MRNMVPAVTPDDLLSEALRIKENGGTGMLISGGCDAFGKVPVLSFTEVLGRISGMGLEINMHAGFLTHDEAKELVNAGVRRFSVDVHQDPDVIRNVLHLNDNGRTEESVRRYESTIENITDAGGRVIPHVTSGFGKDLELSGQLLKRMNIKNAVVLALVPTPGAMTDITPSRETVLRDIGILLDMGLNVTLGCMRSRNYGDLETECLKMGVRHIANPSQRTVEWARDNNIEFEISEKCCCMLL